MAPPLVNPIPSKAHHSTAAAISALSTQYSLTTKLPDPQILEVGREVESFAPAGATPQFKSDLFLALLRERSVR